MGLGLCSFHRAGMTYSPVLAPVIHLYVNTTSGLGHPASYTSTEQASPNQAAHRGQACCTVTWQLHHSTTGTRSVCKPTNFYTISNSSCHMTSRLNILSWVYFTFNFIIMQWFHYSIGCVRCWQLIPKHRRECHAGGRLQWPDSFCSKRDFECHDAQMV